jgi:hypothetical protein
VKKLDKFEAKKKSRNKQERFCKIPPVPRIDNFSYFRGRLLSLKKFESHNLAKPPGVNNIKVTLNTMGFVPGIYFFSVQTVTGVIHSKFVV